MLQVLPFGLLRCFICRFIMLLKTFLECRRNPSIRAGVAEWLSRWPRDPRLHKQGLCQNGQASQWAFGSHGFKSLPRRHFGTWNSKNIKALARDKTPNRRIATYNKARSEIWVY